MLCQNFLISMMKLLFLSFLQKILKWRGPAVDITWRVTGRYCETCGKGRNHKKAAGWPEISSVKKGVGKNFQLTWIFNEDH